MLPLFTLLLIGLVIALGYHLPRVVAVPKFIQIGLWVVSGLMLSHLILEFLSHEPQIFDWNSYIDFVDFLHIPATFELAFVAFAVAYLLVLRDRAKSQPKDQKIVARLKNILEKEQ